MGFLHKLWDETLAGPAPDSGLGKLRKYNSFSAARSTTPDDDDVPISRSITILRTNSNSAAFRKASSPDSASLPSSPAASTTPTSPFSPGTPRGHFKRLTRRESTPDYPSERPDPRNPTVYDWIVINALDR